VVAETAKNFFADSTTKLIMHWTRCTEKQKYDENVLLLGIILLANSLYLLPHTEHY
jgi:hypothetical protein